MTLVWAYLAIGVLTCLAWTSTQLHREKLTARDFYPAPVETALVALVIVGLWPAVLIGWWVDSRRG